MQTLTAQTLTQQTLNPQNVALHPVTEETMLITTAVPASEHDVTSTPLPAELTNAQVTLGPTMSMESHQMEAQVTKDRKCSYRSVAVWGILM